MGSRPSYFHELKVRHVKGNCHLSSHLHRPPPLRLVLIPALLVFLLPLLSPCPFSCALTRVKGVGETKLNFTYIFYTFNARGSTGSSRGSGRETHLSIPCSLVRPHIAAPYVPAPPCCLHDSRVAPSLRLSIHFLHPSSVNGLCIPRSSSHPLPLDTPHRL